MTGSIERSRVPALLRLMRRLSFAVALAALFAALAATQPNAQAAEPVFCDACDNGGSGGTAGGPTAGANVPVDIFIVSGAEQYSYLDSSCNDTTINMDNSLPPAGQYETATYLFQITNAQGDLVDQQTGDFADVASVTGRVHLYTGASIPQGGSASLNVHLQNASTDYDAGILFRGVASGC